MDAKMKAKADDYDRLCKFFEQSNGQYISVHKMKSGCPCPLSHLEFHVHDGDLVKQGEIKRVTTNWIGTVFLAFVIGYFIGRLV